MFLLIAAFVLSGGGLALVNNNQSSAASMSASLNSWWPLDGVRISGAQEFKAVVSDWNVSSYDMFWTVDDGTPTAMPTSYNVSPHKAAAVDVSHWNWRPDGIYKLSFIARNKNGTEIDRTTMNIMVNQPVAATTTAAVVVPKISAPAPTVAAPVATTTISTATAPAASINFYIDPDSAVKTAANAARLSNATNASLLDKIANRPTSKWFGGWNTTIQTDAASYVAGAQSATPVLVAYNIPQRDCGGYSAGGTSANGYLDWIRGMAAGIGSHSAWVILEPDAVAGLECLSPSDQVTRLSLLSQAVTILKSNAATRVYLDGGNPHWIAAGTMATRLKAANIAAADGFSTNVSNYISTDDNTAYGQSISALTNNKHFVIDTSRNGLGPTSDSAWCNPGGRALGNAPSANTGNGMIDAFLWIKTPGESDGSCNGGPAAGVWWTDYAIGLAQRATY